MTHKNPAHEGEVRLRCDDAGGCEEECVFYVQGDLAEARERAESIGWSNNEGSDLCSEHS